MALLESFSGGYKPVSATPRIPFPPRRTVSAGVSTDPKFSMQLMRLADVPLDRRDRLFRYSRFRAVVGATITISSALGAFIFGWLKGAWLAYYVAAVLFIGLLIFQKLITARFRPSNWLLRVTDNGLFIKFRSYLNNHFDDRDLAVVFLPYSEIRSARSVRERREVPDLTEGNRQGTTTKTRQIVEFDLAGDSTQFARALARERERLFGKSVIGAGRISTRYQHLPVRLTTPTLLRIDWGVVPSAQTLLDALTRHTLVQHPAAVTKDFVDLDKLSKEEQEARLLELVESGDTIGALTLARRLYSYDLTAAKQFVEELVDRKSVV